MSHQVSRGRIGRFLRHPLLHFVAIGAALFAIWSWRNPADARETRTVTIDAPRIAWLADTFETQFGHRPSPTEMRATVAGYVDDELRYREALAMGIDRDDTVVRRRLIQKYDFLDASDAPLPANDAVLIQYWRSHRQRYAAPATTAFCQVYVASEPARDVALARTRAILARIEQGGDPTREGDAIDVPRCYDGADRETIARDLGTFFARTVATLPVGAWIGPVESGLGFHVVRVSARAAASPRPFAAVRDDVLRDWRRAQQLADRARRIAALRERYAVHIDDTALEAAAR